MGRRFLEHTSFFFMVGTKKFKKNKSNNHTSTKSSQSLHSPRPYKNIGGKKWFHGEGSLNPSVTPAHIEGWMTRKWFLEKKKWKKKFEATTTLVMPGWQKHNYPHFSLFILFPLTHLLLSFLSLLLFAYDHLLLNALNLLHFAFIENLEFALPSLLIIWLLSSLLISAYYMNPFPFIAIFHLWINFAYFAI